MMRRIDLLPPVYEQRRRERRNIVLVALAGVLVLLLLIGWWFWLGLQISDKKDELATVQQTNAGIQTEIDGLQRFALLQAEVDAKKTALQLVMFGDLDWPALMTEVAMVIPGEVWLDSFQASAGVTEGAAPVGTETATVDIEPNPQVGRISFAGTALSMPGVAKWLLRLESVKEFFAVYLEGATATEGDPTTGGVLTVDFTSTLELSDKAVSGRFQKGIDE
jgi:Tfp pilus assembly protein PilN